MKFRFKNLLLIFVFIISGVLLTGCNKKGFDETKYETGKTYEFSETIKFSDIKQILDDANNELKNSKVYSYTQSLKGEGDEAYIANGTVKIDVRNEAKLSLEFTGDYSAKLYLKENIMYMDLNGDKTATKIETDLSDILEKVSTVVGEVNLFDSSKIKEEDILQAGIDKYNAKVLEFKYEDTKTVTVVIYEGKLMKVMSTSLDLIETTLVYNYDNVEITYPNDLDTYIKK